MSPWGIHFERRLIMRNYRVLVFRLKAPVLGRFGGDGSA